MRNYDLIQLRVRTHQHKSYAGTQSAKRFPGASPGIKCPVPIMIWMLSGLIAFIRLENNLFIMGIPVKAGLASFGMSGRVFHAPLLFTNPGFELSAIMERTKDEARSYYPQVKICRTYKELLEDPNIELIVVNTPDHLHYQMAKEALEAGKHVIVEKPFTQKYSDGLELAELADKKKLILSVFHNRRWDGDFLTVKKVVEEKLLGQLVEYESHFDRFRNIIREDTWKEEAHGGVGTLFNLGSHLIDQIIVLFGRPLSVFATIFTFRPGGKIDDNFELVLEYPGMRVTAKSSLLVREPGPRYALHGTEGSFLKWGIDPQEEKLKAGSLPVGDEWGKENEDEWGIINTTMNGRHFRGKLETIQGNYHGYYDGIFKSIRTGIYPEVNAYDAAYVIRIINTAWESHLKGRKISLK
jgi:scyllo-inositol 2-dehydrogenase (NADP+)